MDMDDKILFAQPGDIVMVNHNSGNNYRCEILEINYYMFNKNKPTLCDYIKFRLLSPKDGLDVFFAERRSIIAIPPFRPKFKVGEEIEFRYNVKWQRGKIQQYYADEDGQIFYDIYPWDERVGAYNSLRGYKEIQEMSVRRQSVLLPPLQPKFKVGDKVIFNSRLNGDNTKGTITKILEKGGISIKNGDYVVKEYGSNSFWEVWEKDITGVWDECTLSMSTDHSDYFDYFRYFPTFSFPTVSDAVLLGIDTDSIKVKKENEKMNNRPRNHKFVKTNTKERRIKEVMFNGPATIIKWERTIDDICSNKKGDKTVSVCGKNDIYDKEKGFLLAVIKEFVDNQSYDNILRMMDSFNDEERK